MYLIGDIGNTSIKICVLNSKFRILRSYYFETNSIYRENFLKIIYNKKVNKDLNDIFLFSSVVPRAFKNIRKRLNLSKYKIL